MSGRPLSLISSAFLSVCFVVILVLPVAKNLLHLGPDIELQEKRSLQKYPVFKWEWKALLSYPLRFEAAFNDHFGFREILVRTQALAKFYWLHMSPSSKVVLGRDGWLYYAASINEYRGLRRLPVASIRQWRKEFVAKKTFLAARGIEYLIVVTPNKETVYPEFLPKRITQIRQRLFMDDLLKALPPDLDVLDLRAPLLRAKSVGRLYFRTDSHWNQLGAAVASDAIVERLSIWFPDLQPRRNQEVFKAIRGNGGNLAEMMGLEDRVREEVIVIPQEQPLTPAPLRSSVKMKRILSNEAVESAGGKQRRNAIVTGDSFTQTLNTFLAAHFRRTLKIRPLVPYKDPFFQSIIEMEKPDVYIDAMVDVLLSNPPK